MLDALKWDLDTAGDEKTEGEMEIQSELKGKYGFSPSTYDDDPFYAETLTGLASDMSFGEDDPQ